MSRGVDYGSVDVPEDTPPEEYHYTARRAEILQLVRQAGHPRAINQSQLARHYGTSQSNISHDLDVLSEYIAETRSARRDLNIDSIHGCAVDGLLQAAKGEDGDWRALEAAWKVEREWNEWLDERQRMEEFRDRLDNIEELLEEHLRRQDSPHSTAVSPAVVTTDNEAPESSETGGGEIEMKWDR